MPGATKGGSELDPPAVERVEWLAQRDLGGEVPVTMPGDPQTEGRWRRYLRDAHPPRFPAPSGVEVVRVEATDAEPFGATAAFGLGLPARTEPMLAALPGKPGWRCFLTRAGSAPAAAASFTEGPITLVAIDASREAGGRSGAHLALLHRMIEEAIEAGARLIGARVDEGAAARDAAAGLLLAGFEKAYLCPDWVDAGLPAS